MADYVNPGAAFAHSFQDVLLQQAQQERQKVLDAITNRREDRLEEEYQLQSQDRRALLQQRMDENKDKQANAFVRRYQLTHGPGDIPDAGTLQRASDLGVSDIFKEDPSTRVAPPPSQSMELPGAMPLPGAPPNAPAPPAMRLGPSPQEKGAPGQQVYPGSEKEQEHDKLQSRLAPLMATITNAQPGTPEYKRAVLQYELESGKSVGSLMNEHAGTPAKLGTVEYYMETLQGQHPDGPTAQQQRSVHKEWGDLGRGPIPPIIIQGTTLEGPQIVDRNKHTAVPILHAADGTPLGPKETATTADRRDRAMKVAVKIPEIQGQIEEADRRGLLGPLAGRTISQFLAEGVGSTGDPANDKLLAQLKSNLVLLSSGTASLHGRGGANVGIVKEINQFLNTHKMSKDSLQGSVESLAGWVNDYADKGELTTLGVPTSAPAGSALPPGVTWRKVK